MRKKFSEEVINLICNMYKNGKSVKDISKELKCCITVIYESLKINNIPLVKQNLKTYLPNTRICTHCNKEKPLSDLYNGKRYAQGKIIIVKIVVMRQK